MMQLGGETLSLVPILLLTLVGGIGVFTLRTARAGAISAAQALAVFLALAAVSAWTVVSARLSLLGVYASAPFLRWLPGLWLPFVPILMFQLLRLAKPGREALAAIMDHIAPVTVVVIEGLRIAGVGTLIKTTQGDFPVHFELLTGVPDLLYGLSAPYILYRIANRSITWRGLARWHLVGLLILIPAGLFIQMGLPGPIQVFKAQPTSLALFTFPMAWVPTVVVPLFAFLNSWSAAWLAARRPDDLTQPFSSARKARLLAS